MPLPTINTYSVDDDNICLFWKASPKSNIKKWNVYGASAVPINIDDPIKGVDTSGFTLIREGIANRDCELTPGSVYSVFSRTELGIGNEDTYYFILTSVDGGGVESSIEVSNLHAVPFSDDFFVDEAGQPFNVVYSNFEFTMSQTLDWDKDRFIDVVSLLGRPAKQLRIATKDQDIQIKFNSFNGDGITIAQSDTYPFILSRGELLFKKIWFNKLTAGTTSVRVFVAG